MCFGFLCGQNSFEVATRALKNRIMAVLLAISICFSAVPRAKATPLAALAPVLAPYLIALVLAAGGIYLYADNFDDMSETLEKSYRQFVSESGASNPVPFTSLVGSAAQGGVTMSKIVYNSLIAFAHWFVAKYGVQANTNSQVAVVVQGTIYTSAYTLGESNPVITYTNQDETANITRKTFWSNSQIYNNGPQLECYLFAYVLAGYYHTAFYFPTLSNDYVRLGTGFATYYKRGSPSYGGSSARQDARQHVYDRSRTDSYYKSELAIDGYSTTINTTVPVLSVGTGTEQEVEAAAISYFGAQQEEETLGYDASDVAVPPAISDGATGAETVKGITVPGTETGVISPELIEQIVTDLVESRELPDEQIKVTDITLADGATVADDGTITPAADVTVSASSFPVDATVFEVSGLERYFPFGIPFQAQRVLQAFVATPTTPILDFRLNFGFGIPEQTIHVDLTEFNSIAEICRYMLFLEYAVSLLNWLFSVFVG